MNLKYRYLLVFVFIISITTCLQSLYAQDFVAENRKRAQEAIASVEANNNFRDDLNHVDMNMLPSGIQKTFGNMEVTIAVNDAEFFKDHTQLSVFAKVKIPDGDRIFFFGGKNIKFSHGGELIGDARIVLLGDIDIPLEDGNVIFRLKGDYGDQTGQMADMTYVELDCQGFKSMRLTAEVELDPDVFKKVDKDGNIDPKGKVTGMFRTEISSWNDILANISLPSFAIDGLDGFIWNIENAVFDFSDIRNNTSVRFPNAYRENYLIPGYEALWRGVYVKDFSITLPPQFSEGNNKRVSFTAQDMLIDNNGVSGDFIANLPILSIDDGDANGWSFSVDQFAIRLLASNLEQGSFSGLIGLPISEDSYLGYTGTIAADNQYILEVETLDTLQFSAFGATAQIDLGSYVKMHVVDNKFKPEAMLHGRMGMAVKLEEGSDKAIANIKGIEFRSMHLKTEAPYFAVQYLGYNDAVNLAGFPVSIRDIGIRATEKELALGIGIDVTLDNTFKGGTYLEIIGEREEGKRHRYRYKKTEIGEITVEAEIAEVMTLKGSLKILSDDPVYGDGYDGELGVSFNENLLGGLDLKMRGMFGYHKGADNDSYRYWFVDGAAQLPVGIMVFPGFSLTGFGGGISNRMRPEGVSASTNGQAMGATSMKYVPDENNSLGIKAAAFFSIAEKAANGEACFELSFNRHGGLSYAGFYGNVEFAADFGKLGNIQDMVGGKYADIVKKEKDFLGDNKELKAELEKTKQINPNKAASDLYSDKDKLGKEGMTAAIGIEFNFAQSSFHATFDLYVNAANGMLRGTASGNRAGYGVLHIDPNEWYVHMGTPTNRIGLKMAVGSLASIETGSYFMLGTKIEAAPGHPVFRRRSPLS